MPVLKSISTSLPNIRAGKLRGLAVSSAQRSPFLPDVPTVAEQGFPGFNVAVTTIFAVPTGTPAGACTMRGPISSAMPQRSKSFCSATPLGPVE